MRRSAFRLVHVACTAAILGQGCASLPANTCGDPPKPLHNGLDGLEYVYRARAWESYALCLQSLVAPEAPVEVEAPPLVIPDMRKAPSPNPWDGMNPRPRKPAPGERQARAVVKRQPMPVGEGPSAPVWMGCRVASNAKRWTETRCA